MKKNLVVQILIGIPASGKSTWSKKFLAENPNYVRINRDDFRFMLRNEPVCEPKIEDTVTSLVNASIDAALSRKLNVIVDNTHLKRKYIDATIAHVINRADVKFRVFDISLDKAIERDAAREKVVGEAAIKRMYKDYKDLMDGFDYSDMSMIPFIYENPEMDENLPNAVIFDLDGTLAHANGKRGYFDWDKVDRDELDTIVWGTYDLYRRGEGDYQILIVTGRDEQARPATERWLEFHGIEYDQLLMRPENNMEPDTKIKRKIYEDHIKDRYNVHVVFDDRQKVVDMWRSLGLKVYQVNKAD